MFEAYRPRYLRRSKGKRSDGRSLSTMESTAGEIRPAFDRPPVEKVQFAPQTVEKVVNCTNSRILPFLNVEHQILLFTCYKVNSYLQ